MTTAEAAAYCRYRTSFGILKAHARGLVRAFRRGRTYLWRREDLDDFLAGGADGDVDQPVPGLRDPALTDSAPACTRRGTGDGSFHGKGERGRAQARGHAHASGGDKAADARSGFAPRDARRSERRRGFDPPCRDSASTAPSLYARKVAQRELKSAKSRERWDFTLRLHLLPAFGRLQVDAITKLDIESWKTRIATKIVRNQMSPRTANGWLSHSTRRHSVRGRRLRARARSHAAVKDFAVDEHPTYTDENPNALTPAQASEFLARMRVMVPALLRHRGLGFVTVSLRPSTPATAAMARAERGRVVEGRRDPRTTVEPATRRRGHEHDQDGHDVQARVAARGDGPCSAAWASLGGG